MTRITTNLGERELAQALCDVLNDSLSDIGVQGKVYRGDTHYVIDIPCNLDEYQDPVEAGFKSLPIYNRYVTSVEEL